MVFDSGAQSLDWLSRETRRTMARRRFYANPDHIHAPIITLSADETHHLIRVLRMTPGDAAFVFDGAGREFSCTFKGVRNNHAELEIENELADRVDSPLRLILAQALVKGEKFDFIGQKATELGVSRVVPLITQFADPRLDDQQMRRRVERWERISLEALKQCGRRRLVEIETPLSLTDLLNASGPSSKEASTINQHLLVFSEKSGVAVNDAIDIEFVGG